MRLGQYSLRPAHSYQTEDDMHISRVEIKNFRNLVDFNIDLAEKAVILGENGAGKTNFFDALRFLLDPTYRIAPTASDFSRGITPFRGTKMEFHLWFSGFNPIIDQDLLACAHDCRVSNEGDPLQVKISCVYQPKPNIVPTDAVGEDEYELIRYGRDDITNSHGASRFRSYIKLFLIPALRDIDREMQNWRFSPLRLLLESMSLTQNDEFIKVAKKVEAAGNDLRQIASVSELQQKIRDVLGDIIDDANVLNPTIGLLPSNPDALQRLLTLFIDADLPLERSSLGLSNILYLTMQLVYFEMLRTSTKASTQYTILAIEEPEAHLHPHMQRLVFSNIFKRQLSLLISTHSSTIVSLAKPEWFALFKSHPTGITAVSTSQIASLNAKIRKDISRFLDATRGEVVFSRAVILVEGDAEMFLIPEMARRLKEVNEIPQTLDGAGISVCSVFGTDFTPYVQFLGTDGLNIPFAIITDGDIYVGLRDKARQLKADSEVRQESKEHIEQAEVNRDWESLRALLEQHNYGHYEGLKRGIALVELLNPNQVATIQALYDLSDWAKVIHCLEQSGIFVNRYTLEAELISVNYKRELIEVYAELGGSQIQQENFCSELNSADTEKVIRRIETTGMGKGRFAQRLSERVVASKIPPYITRAIKYLFTKISKPSHSEPVDEMA